MEQQKLSKNIQSITKLQSNQNDTMTIGQRTQKSLHNISKINNLSKSKITSGPQVVISYNFQNQNNTQLIRTHNLLIGLEDLQQRKGNKSTFRKNVLHRVNYVSTSNDKIPKQSSSLINKKNQLLKVKSNDILIVNNNNNNLRQPVTKSFHNNNQTYQQIQRFPINQLNSQQTHLNTFWKNTTTNDTGYHIENVNKLSHEKHINSNITKIGSRKSLNKAKSQMNVYVNSIQKVKRQKVSGGGQVNNTNNSVNGSSKKSNNNHNININKNPSNQTLPQTKNINYNNNNKNQQQISEHNQQSQQISNNKQITQRYHNKNNNNQDQYNQKLQKILRNVKRQNTKQSLQAAYDKQQNSFNQKYKNNSTTNKMKNSQQLYQFERQINQQQQFNQQYKKVNKNNIKGNNDIDNNLMMLEINRQQNQFSQFIQYPSSSSYSSKKNIPSSLKKNINTSSLNMININNNQRQFNYQLQQLSKQNYQNQQNYTQQQSIQQNPPYGQNFRINNLITTKSTTTKHSSINNQITNYHRNLIQKQNQSKKNKQYKQLIKNNSYKLMKNDRVSLAEQFHRIDSENQNQIGSSKKQSQKDINNNNKVKYKENNNINMKQQLPGVTLSPQRKNNSNNNSIDKNVKYQQIIDKQKNKIYRKNYQIVKNQIHSNNKFNNSPNNNNQIKYIKRQQINHLQTKNHNHNLLLNKNNQYLSSSLNQQNQLKEQKEQKEQNQLKNHIKLKEQKEQNEQKELIKLKQNNQQHNLNLSLNGNTSAIRKNQQPSLTKRKLPTDYNEFLKLLSQQNQKKRQAQDQQKQRQRSLFQKNSRFKNIIAQNQHIKRIMTPIRNDFLQDRHRRLSQQRKQKDRRSIEDQKNGDYSIIQGDYNTSYNRHKPSRHSQPHKMKSQFIEKSPRNDIRSKSMMENFSHVNKSLEKGRNKFDRGGLVDNEILQSEIQSQGINERTHRKIKQANEKERRNKINKESYQNSQQEQNFQYSSHENSGDKFYKSYQEKGLHKASNKKQSKKNHSNYQQNQVIGKLTGMKIPAQVIERANSRLNRKNYQKQTTKNNKGMTNKTRQNNQFASSSNKEKNNNGKDQNGFVKSQSGPFNKSTHNNNKGKNAQLVKDQQNKNHQKEGYEDNKNVNNYNKMRYNTKTDKRVAKQKQRKFKDWKNSSQDQKDKKQQIHHNARDKQINKKDWKYANKNNKNKKNKDKKQQGQSSQQQLDSSLQNEYRGRQEKYSINDQNNNKKDTKVIKKRKLYGQNQTQQSDDNQDKNENENDNKKQYFYGQVVENRKNNLGQLDQSNDLIQGKDINGKIKKNDNHQNDNKKLQGKKQYTIKEQNGLLKKGQSMQQKDKQLKSNDKESTNNNKGQALNLNHQQNEQKSVEENYKYHQNKTGNNLSQQVRQTDNKQISHKNKIQQNNQTNQQDENQQDQQNEQQLQQNTISQLSPQQITSNPPNQKLNTTLQNFIHDKIKKNTHRNPNQSPSQQKQQYQQQLQQKKKQVIEKVIENQEMQQNGFMEITQSKFQLYNHQSQKSIFYQTVSRFHLNNNKNQILQKRAQLVKYIYSLPEQYQSQIDKFQPNEDSTRIISQDTFQKLNLSMLKNVQSQKLRKVLEEISVYDKIRSISFGLMKKNINEGNNNKNKSFFRKIFEPYQNLTRQYGVWVYCVGVWRLILVPIKNQQQVRQEINQSYLLDLLQIAIHIALQKYYCNIKMDQIKNEQLIKMITGLRVSTLTRTNKNLPKLFKEIQYNTRKSHIIRAINNQSTDSKFSTQTINCVRKIENTPTGQKVIQIVSYSLNSNDSDKKQRYFWIKEEKFLEFFNSFTIISKRNTESNWTNKLIEIKNQEKAVYMIESNEKHTSGSITIYPLDSLKQKTRQKCTIAFYKQIQPQVLKLIGRASQRLPQNEKLVHLSKLYFEFNIKGTYFVFLELQDGQYNVAIESNSSSTSLDFVEFVKKQTMRNEHAQYVEIDKIFKKKPNVEAFQNSREFKQLLNFMKKTAPQVYEAK